MSVKQPRTVKCPKCDGYMHENETMCGLCEVLTSTKTSLAQAIYDRVAANKVDGFPILNGTIELTLEDIRSVCSEQGVELKGDLR
jgi:hypothetical protein